MSETRDFDEALNSLPGTDRKKFDNLSENAKTAVQDLFEESSDNLADVINQRINTLQPAINTLGELELRDKFLRIQEEGKKKRRKK